MAAIHLKRGLALTLIGFASKAYFILFIAPGMAEGEFAQYFLAVSVALIAARILGIGSHEDLVFRVRHNVERISYYLRGAALYYIMAWTLLLIGNLFSANGALYGAALSYSLILAGNGFMTGALRSYSSLFQEINANSPWLLLCLMSVMFEVESANDVLMLVILSYTCIYVANILMAHRLGIDVRSPSLRVLAGQLRRYQSWMPKSLSSMAMAANLRSYPLWLSGLGYVLSDGIAYAFIIGEVIYQLCMVYVHQIHSSLKLQDDLFATHRLMRVGLVMMGLAVTVPLPVYYAMNSGIVSHSIDVSLLTLLCVSVYCGTLAFLSLIRIGAWRKEKIKGAMRILAVQAVTFICVGVMVVMMRETVVVLFGAAALNILLIYLYVNRYIIKHSSTWF